MNSVKTMTVVNNFEEFGKFIDVALTLLARDYKGAGHYSFNAVLVWKQ